jgi:phosphate transport system substrate-binding protein
LAGSGSNIALMRRVLGACASGSAPLDIAVAEGIGSGGGLRALSDGMIDIAVVSRPLRPEEHPSSWMVWPYARSAVTWAAHPTAPLAAWTAEQLLVALAQPRPLWPDGQPLQWLLREAGDSSHSAAVAHWPQLSALEQRTRRRSDAQIYYHDRTMHAALWSTPGAVGLVDASAVQAEGLPLPLLRLGDTAASAEAIAGGRWPLVKTQALVFPVALAERVAPLQRCLASEVGRAVIHGAGAQPLQELP